VTATARQLTTGRTAPASTPLSAPGPAGPPRLAHGVELLGEYRDSGYSQPPSLVRRPDGQVIQMSPLLYQVTCAIDGSRDAAAIAGLVSAELGRSLTADQVRHLITAKLQPLGVLASQDSPAAPPRARPLLALRARGTLLPERATNGVAVLLRPLFRWPAVAAVTVSFVGIDCWLLASHALGAGLEQLLRSPIGLLAVFGLTVLAGAFHECGHATGCRYSGARPGVIGAGIYLVWPSFFTNVTDSYRLGRTGRLRTDLGGVYFNAIFILVLAGVYAATSDPILLLVIVITQVEMLQQLIPVVRFDGYFILSDLAGVPDMFARVAPIVKSVLPGRRRDPRIADLRRGTRILVTCWVLAVIPLLIAFAGYLLLRLPEVSRALWRSVSLQGDLMTAAAARHDYAMAAVDAIGAALVSLSLAGLLYIATGLARRAVTLGVRWSAGRPARRLVAAAAAVAGVATLAALWTVQGGFQGW
jgi:putative peptide zinc metalloprotease protein